MQVSSCGGNIFTWGYGTTKPTSAVCTWSNGTQSQTGQSVSPVPAGLGTNGWAYCFSALPTGTNITLTVSGGAGTNPSTVTFQCV